MREKVTEKPQAAPEVLTRLTNIDDRMTNPSGILELQVQETRTEKLSENHPSDAKVERVALGPDATRRLDAWIKQIEGSRPGVIIHRRDLIHWLILSRGEALTSAEVQTLSASHYNELRFLQYALRELKAARARGEALGLEDFVCSTLGSNNQALKKLRRPRSKEKGSTPLNPVQDAPRDASPLSPKA